MQHTINGLAKLTLLDFPGKTAATAFLAGCNFRCPFCHNAPLVTELEGAQHIGYDELEAFLKKRAGLLDGIAITGGEPTLLTVGDLKLDLLRRKVERAGVDIDLQPLEFQLLEYLMRNHGRVVSKTTILEHVWEYNFDTQTNIVEAAIFRLRDKIDKDFEPKMIRTVRGFGYVLE